MQNKTNTDRMYKVFFFFLTNTQLEKKNAKQNEYRLYQAVDRKETLLNYKLQILWLPACIKTCKSRNSGHKMNNIKTFCPLDQISTSACFVHQPGMLGDNLSVQFLFLRIKRCCVQFLHMVFKTLS